MYLLVLGTFGGRFFLDFSMRYLDCMIGDISRYKGKGKGFSFSIRG